MSGRNRLWRVAESPTTSANVERVFSYFIVAVRLGTVAQMIPAVHIGVATSPNAAAYLACWVAAALTLVVVSVVTLVRRRPLGAAASAADFVFAYVLLVLGPVVLVSGERFGTWVAYQPGYALAIILTAGGVRSLALWAGGLVGVVVCFVVYLSGGAGENLISTAISNVLMYVVYAIVARMFFGYTRRVAHDADVSRARAAELARREEERRAQVMMHNGVALMRLLTEPGTDAARSRLLDQAEVELRRMRSYLRGQPPDGTRSAAYATAGSDPPVRLAAMIERVCERFADLYVDALLDLGAEVRLSAAQAEAVERALESLLLNVREHAQADAVVVHLDQGWDGSWTLTLRDDGVGFDPASVSAGVGLREIVVGELCRRGLVVDIESAAGEGTTVTISSGSGPAAAGTEQDVARDAA